MTKMCSSKFDHILEIGNEFTGNRSSKRAVFQLAESTFNLHTKAVHAETYTCFFEED